MGFKMVSFEELLIDSTRNGISKPKSIRGEGTPMINMGELFRYDRIPNLSNLELVPLTASEKERFLLEKGDLLFARRSLTLEGAGKCSIYLSEVEATFESSIIRARIDPSKANPQFYYYYFSSPIGKALIGSIAEQVAVAGIRGSDLKKLKVHYLEKKTQDKIMNMLMALDDKIDVNKRVITNIEQLAQTLFKRWFVDFEFPNENGEPYKSSSGEMSEIGSGLIPKEWKEGYIGEIACVRSGYAFKSDWWLEKGLPVIKIKDIQHNTINLSKLSFVSKEKGELAKRFEVGAGDLVIALTGATLGKIALIPKIEGKLLVNQRVGKFFLGVEPLKNIAFIYSLLSLDDVMNEIVDRGSGSAQANLSPSNLEGIKINIPQQHLIDSFNKQLSSTFELMTTLEYENQKLKSLRETLLPKLLSGEIVLPDETEVKENVPIS